MADLKKILVDLLTTPTWDLYKLPEEAMRDPMEMDEHETIERGNDREEATEHDKHQLVKAARNLMLYGFNLTPEEDLAIAHVLRVFDPQPPVEEEEDIKF